MSTIATEIATEIPTQLRPRVRAGQPPERFRGAAMIAPGAEAQDAARPLIPGASPAAGPTGAGGGARPPSTFNGALLPICGVEVLIVVVRPWVLADVHEANLFVVAFHERFRRTIVLVAQGPRGEPYYYGPIEIVRVLQQLPLEMIPWRRLLLRALPPPGWQLPIPQPRGGAGPTEAVDSADLSLAPSAGEAARAHLPSNADLRTTVR